MSLSAAFGTIRDALNTALVPEDIQNPLMLYPKHPSVAIEDGDQFPYYCAAFVGFDHDYTQTDLRWQKPSERLARIQIWLCIAQGEDDSLSADLIALCEKLETAVKAISANRANSFRVRVQTGESEYDPANRWGMTAVTLVIGAYGS